MHSPPLFHSWEPHRSKKRSHRPESQDDDGFEIVPIEDPGESSVPSGMGRNNGSFSVGN